MLSFLSCCFHKRNDSVEDLRQNEPNEHTQLITPQEDDPTPEFSPSDPYSKRQRANERMAAIVRRAEGRMVNVNAPHPFNLANLPPPLARRRSGSDSRSRSLPSHDDYTNDLQNNDHYLQQQPRGKINMQIGGYDDHDGASPYRRPPLLHYPSEGDVSRSSSASREMQYAHRPPMYAARMVSMAEAEAEDKERRRGRRREARAKAQAAAAMGTPETPRPGRASAAAPGWVPVGGGESESESEEEVERPVIKEVGPLTMGWDGVKL